MSFEKGRLRIYLRCAVLAAVVLCGPAFAAGQAPDPTSENPLGIPDFGNIIPVAQDRAQIGATLKIFMIMTVLTLAPSIIMMTTCFVRIVVVLGFLRQAVGTANLPPGQVITGLAMFMTFLIMAPTWGKLNREVIQPYLNNEPGMTQARTLEMGAALLRGFMIS